jgi:hypothetical protein
MKENGADNHGNGNGNHAGDSGHGSGNNGHNSLEAARTLLAQMVPELSRVIATNRNVIAQGRAEFAAIPVLAQTFDHFDAQLTAVDESLSRYPNLPESDTDLSLQIAAVEAMKDQNCEQANLAFKLTI